MDSISKTQRKHAMQALQELGEELVRLSRERLDQLDLPERLANAILEAQRIHAHEGKRRQLQFIGRLMREVDAEPIAAQLERWKQPGRAQAKLHQQAEAWRAKLLENDTALSELHAQVPALDAAQAAELIRQARWEHAQGKPPKASRALFRVLSSALHAPQPTKSQT